MCICVFMGVGVIQVCEYKYIDMYVCGSMDLGVIDTHGCKCSVHVSVY